MFTVHCTSLSQGAILLYNNSSKLTEMRICSGVGCFFSESADVNVECMCNRCVTPSYYSQKKQLITLYFIISDSNTLARIKTTQSPLKRRYIVEWVRSSCEWQTIRGKMTKRAKQWLNSKKRDICQRLRRRKIWVCPGVVPLPVPR